MGTPEFAVPSLRHLILEEDVICVVTQPDRPKGRGRVMSPPPVKTLALDNDIPVFQPEGIKGQDFLGELKRLNPDIIVVVSYGNILPESILHLPQFGCINVHASLLPKYRGAAPINRAIIRGEKITGITTIQMDKGMDTGDMLLQESIPIEDGDDAGTLYNKLSILGARTLKETLALLKCGKLNAVPQDHSKATYAPLLKKKDGEILWENDAEKISNFIRGMNPWPGAYTFYKGKRIKILRAVSLDRDTGLNAGTIEHVSGEGINVSTGKGILRVLTLQTEGKRPMEVSDFIQGFKIEAGEGFERG